MVELQQKSRNFAFLLESLEGALYSFLDTSRKTAVFFGVIGWSKKLNIFVEGNHLRMFGYRMVAIPVAAWRRLEEPQQFMLSLASGSLELETWQQYFVLDAACPIVKKNGNIFSFLFNSF